jgi:PAS domain S-box-containing protein
LAATLRSETTGEPFSMEYRCLHRDGHIVWVQDEAVILSRSRDNEPSLFQGVMFDITSRKDAEAKAARSELRYRDLAEQVPGIIYLLEMNPDGSGFSITYVGPQVREILGLEPDAWRTDEDWIASIHPDDRERIAAMSAEYTTSGAPFIAEYRMLHADGSIVWVRDRGRVVEADPFGQPRIVQGLAEDITDEVSAAQRAREAHDRYQALVEQIPAMVYVEAPSPEPNESPFLYLSPQTEAIVGYTIEELMADPSHFGRMLHPDDRDRVLAANARTEESGEPFDEEYRVVAKDGRVVWLHSRATLVRDDGGRPRYWHGVALDVTEVRTAQDNLRVLEERYEDLAGRTFRNLGIDAD